AVRRPPPRGQKPPRRQPQRRNLLVPVPTRDKSLAVVTSPNFRAPSLAMEEFHRIRRLPPYVFEQVNRAKAQARNGGADIIDLGMGNPGLPTPAHDIEKLKDTIGKPRTD